MNPADELAVRTHLNRFANCFDTKQWAQMLDCLAPSVDTDYADLRGTPPETLSPLQFVDMRREALDKLATQHLFANHEIDLCGDFAKARVSATIFRRAADGRTLQTHCLYLFELRRMAQEWKISAIAQKVYWSDGDKRIHAGVVPGH